MTIAQPTIWDNLHLEKGLYHLSELQMDEAVEQLSLALKGPFDQEDAHAAMEAAQYWQTRMLARPVNPSLLLKDYTSYPFITRLNGFRKNLLRFIADRISEQSEAEPEEMETAFDMLLAIKDFKKAEEFISTFINLHPDKYILRSFFAQAQWKNGNKGAANKNYILALLHAPDSVPIDRIENDELKKIIADFGPAMAPAYGWISGILPFVVCSDEITACDERHQKALRSYHLLQKAHACLKKNDTKTATPYRKQLKEEAPQLYEAYFELLNQRK